MTDSKAVNADLCPRFDTSLVVIAGIVRQCCSELRAPHGLPPCLLYGFRAMIRALSLDTRLSF
jgi:hypothetical protein